MYAWYYPSRRRADPMRLPLRPANAARRSRAADPTLTSNEIRAWLQEGFYEDVTGPIILDRCRRIRWYEWHLLAAHPNAPLDVLSRVLEICPIGFCRNPILPLLPLEVPGFFAEAGGTALRNLLREPELPSDIAFLLTSPTTAIDSALKEEVGLHIASAGELILDSPSALRVAIHSFWQEHIQKGQDTGTRQACIELVEAGLLPQWAAGPLPWPGPGARPTVERQIRKALANTPELVSALRQAASPESSPKELETLAEAKPESRRLPLQIALAGNPKTPPHLLRQLARQTTECLQMAVAYNSAAPADVVVELLNKTNLPWVRRILWQHPNLPSEQSANCKRILQHKMLAENRQTRYSAGSLPGFAALATPDTPIPILREAALSQQWERRLAAALFLPLSPADEPLLRFVLAEDGNRLVRGTARFRLDYNMPPQDLWENQVPSDSPPSLT